MAELVAFFHRCEGNERSKQRQRGVKQPERAPAQCVEAISKAHIGERARAFGHYSRDPDPGQRWCGKVGWRMPEFGSGELGDGNERSQ